MSDTIEELIGAIGENDDLLEETFGGMLESVIAGMAKEGVSMPDIQSLIMASREDAAVIMAEEIAKRLPDVREEGAKKAKLGAVPEKD